MISIFYYISYKNARNNQRFPRIEQNKIILKPEPYFPDEFERSIKNVIEEMSRRRDISFSFIHDGTEDNGILVDKIRLNQIFINLLSNAVKFTKRGGKVELIAETLKTNAKENNQDVIRKRFIVKDNGIGMSEEFIPHAYDNFRQEYRTEDVDKEQGTGLGLSIVKDLVKLMNGTIRLESKINVGTTFTVELEFPVVERNAIVDNSNNKSYDSINGAKILIVEDNDINIEIAVSILNKYNCIIDKVVNGKEACEKFADSEEYYYDLILMDIRMPIMDGLTASRKIREMNREDAKRIPIIAMTADVFNDDEMNSHKAGMNDHLIKPVNPKALYDICSKYIEL